VRGKRFGWLALFNVKRMSLLCVCKTVFAIQHGIIAMHDDGLVLGLYSEC
jgi:hypothetical protein